jgi:hypothetical protein
MTDIVRYWSHEARESKAYPCKCTDPSQADEGESFECSHGRWLYVDDSRLAEKQKKQIFNGTNMNLFLAMDLGLAWGDLMYEWEKMEREAETDVERARRLVLEAKKMEELRISLITSHVNKFNDIYCDKKSGKLKKREMRPCKWFCHGGVLGRAEPGRDGWAAGCQAHLKKVCPFIHPDEAEWGQLSSGTRNFGALKERVHH